MKIRHKNSFITDIMHVNEPIFIKGRHEGYDYGYLTYSEGKVYYFCCDDLHGNVVCIDVTDEYEILNQ